MLRSRPQPPAVVRGPRGAAGGVRALRHRPPPRYFLRAGTTASTTPHQRSDKPMPHCIFYCHRATCVLYC